MKLGNLVESIKALSAIDFARLKNLILSGELDSEKSIEDFLIGKRFENGETCPLCGDSHIVRNGHRKDGTQKFVCRSCGKAFGITTNSITSGSKKDLDVWSKYISCMLEGLTIEASADKCSISKNTSFAWRHKILDALQNMAGEVHLSGVVEADETFVALSYKGNHKRSKRFRMPRRAHKRGHDIYGNVGMNEHACVPCAVTRDGLSIAKIARPGNISSELLSEFFKGRIAEDSVVVSDASRIYSKFAEANKLAMVGIKHGKGSEGIYSMGHINNYHSQMKRFINHRFNGVSTKYLNNYLVWHNFINWAKGTSEEKREIFTTFVLSTLRKVRYCDLSSRAAIPIFGLSVKV